MSNNTSQRRNCINTEQNNNANFINEFVGKRLSYRIGLYYMSNCHIHQRTAQQNDQWSHINGIVQKFYYLFFSAYRCKFVDACAFWKIYSVRSFFFVIMPSETENSLYKESPISQRTPRTQADFSMFCQIILNHENYHDTEEDNVSVECFFLCI